MVNKKFFTHIKYTIGKLVKILRITGVTRYNMEFMLVEGSYVYKWQKIHKVPCTAAEVAVSPLMGLFEKGRCKSLLSYVYGYVQADPKTHQGLDLYKAPMKEVYKKFGVAADTIDFLGHAVGLYTNDDYIEKEPAMNCVERLKLYADSLALYGKSPYVYPLYGLGELPQVFARLCAVNGGTYMLNKPVDKVHYDENGVVVGVESQGEIAKCKFVVGDPSYFPDKVKKTGQVVRVICILNHPLANCDNTKSCQVIIPQKEAKRGHDIYVLVTSFAHKVAPAGKYIAIVSTTVESNDPEKEVEPGMKLLGAIEEKFVYVLDTFEPISDGKKDQVFISKSYDATTHYESSAVDIVDIFERITGTKFDWNAKPPAAAEDQQ